MAKITAEFDWDEFMEFSHQAKRTPEAHYLVMCDYDEETWVCGNVYHNLLDAYRDAKKRTEIENDDPNYYYYILKIDVKDGNHHRISLAQCQGSDFDID